MASPVERFVLSPCARARSKPSVRYLSLYERALLDVNGILDRRYRVGRKSFRHLTTSRVSSSLSLVVYRRMRSCANLFFFSFHSCFAPVPLVTSQNCNGRNIIYVHLYILFIKSFYSTLMKSSYIEREQRSLGRHVDAIK